MANRVNGHGRFGSFFRDVKHHPALSPIYGASHILPQRPEGRQKCTGIAKWLLASDTRLTGSEPAER